MPLGLLGQGEAGEIVEIRASKLTGTVSLPGETGRCDGRIEDLGVRVGRTVVMLNNAGGAILLKVDESRIALARSLAMKIMIKEVAR
jgi:ferrous iron transport protein A